MAFPRRECEWIPRKVRGRRRDCQETPGDVLKKRHPDGGGHAEGARCNSAEAPRSNFCDLPGTLVPARGFLHRANFTAAISEETMATYAADARHISAEDARTQLRRAVIASTVGTTIEWYDFFLYSTVTGLV